MNKLVKTIDVISAVFAAILLIAGVCSYASFFIKFVDGVSSFLGLSSLKEWVRKK